MAVGADEFAFGDFDAEFGDGCEVGYVTEFDAMNVVELHHVVRVFFATI
jgi:hypothetical protein